MCTMNAAVTRPATETSTSATAAAQTTATATTEQTTAATPAAQTTGPKPKKPGPFIQILKPGKPVPGRAAGTTTSATPGKPVQCTCLQSNRSLRSVIQRPGSSLQSNNYSLS